MLTSVTDTAPAVVTLNEYSDAPCGGNEPENSSVDVVVAVVVEGEVVVDAPLHAPAMSAAASNSDRRAARLMGAPPTR